MSNQNRNGRPVKQANITVTPEQVPPKAGAHVAQQIAAAAEYQGAVMKMQGLNGQQPPGTFASFPPGDVPPELALTPMPVNPNAAAAVLQPQHSPFMQQQPHYVQPPQSIHQQPAPLPFNPAMVPQQMQQQAPQQQWQAAPAPAQFPQQPQFQQAPVPIAVPQAPQLQYPGLPAPPPPAPINQAQVGYNQPNQFYVQQVQQQQHPQAPQMFNTQAGALPMANPGMMPPTMEGYQVPNPAPVMPYGSTPHFPHPAQPIAAPYQQPLAVPGPNGMVQISPQNPNFAPPRPPSSLQQFQAQNGPLPHEFPEVTEVFRGAYANEVPLNGYTTNAPAYAQPQANVRPVGPGQAQEVIVRHEMPTQDVAGYRLRSYLLTADGVEYQANQVLLRGRDDFAIDALIRNNNSNYLIPLSDVDTVTCPQCHLVFGKNEAQQTPAYSGTPTHNDGLNFS